MFKHRPNSILRFNLLVIFFFTLAGLFIIGKAAIIMFIERDDWNKIKENNPHKSTVLILPGCNHGNGMYKQTKLYQDAIQAFLYENFER